MPDHPFHRTIGKLVKGLGLAPNKEIWVDPACDAKSPGVVTLFHGTGSDRVRFCQVDILILAHDKVVVIEIEESNVKPLHLFGKFYASVFSTHFNDQDISKLPLLFIQVLDSSKLKKDKSKKEGQWDRLEEILINHDDGWPGRQVKYKMFRGGTAGFGWDGKEGEELIMMVSGFLSELRDTK